MAVRVNQNAMESGGMPRGLQLDLLVDAELPEGDRRLLLQTMGERPGEWRELAMLFLQRQVEKETVRKLMAGGSVVPVELVTEKPAVAGWIGSTRMLATAAGLLIAVTSALITVYAMQMNSGAEPARNRVVADDASSHFLVEIPADAMASDRNIPMNVPLVKMGAGNATLFPAGNGDGSTTARRSWVIQPDGHGGAVLVPVNTLKAKVY